MNAAKQKASADVSGAAGETVPRSAGQKIAKLAAGNWLFGVLVLLVIGFSLMSDSFLSRGNWLNVTDTAVAICLLAAAQTLLIIAGGIDLSQGSVMGLSGVVGAWTMLYFFGGAATSDPFLAMVVGFAATLATGLFFGLVNGLIIARSRLNAFIVTLGGYQVCLGFSNLVSNGQEMTDMPTVVGQFGNYYLGGLVSLPVLVTLVVVAALIVMLRYTRFGKYTYVIGDSREAAVRAGVAVDRHLLILYVLSGVLSALAGLLVMARLSDASPTAGQDLLLNSIAAAIIGGASLAGGRGSVGRTVIGGVIISVLLIGLVIANVQPFWQQVVVGIVLVCAVFIDERGFSLNFLRELMKRRSDQS